MDPRAAKTQGALVQRSGRGAHEVARMAIASRDNLIKNIAEVSPMMDGCYIHTGDACPPQSLSPSPLRIGNGRFIHFKIGNVI